MKKPEADDLQLYSVTTIIGALGTPALLYWAAEQTAEAACDVAGSLAMRIDEDGRENVVKWLRDARFRKPKGKRSATELGTEVHAACEEYALTGTRPEVDDEVWPFIEQFDRWAQRAQPEYESVEVTVYHPTYSYAGTLDGIFKLGGQSLIFDIKTTRNSVDARGKPTSPYPDQVALQLAAYRYSELAAVWRPRRVEKFRRRYYLLNQDEQEMAIPTPKVDGGCVLHITPDHCECFPMRCDEPVFDAFLYTLECFRWVNETSKTVMAKPLEFG